MLDVSMSTTTNGLTGRLHREGKLLDHPWLQDAEGRASRDPAVLFTDPPGSILPMGGQDHGHKGFALGLLVEALTSGLGGFGRADEGHQWGANVLVQIIDPEAFGGLDAFRRETGWLAQACRDTPALPDRGPVRLPGARGLSLRARQLEDGVRFHPGIVDSLAPWSEKLGIPIPDPT